MEIRGKVINKQKMDYGTSSRGAWAKAGLIIRYEEGQYPKDILLTNMRKAEEFDKVPVGSTGTFKFDARSHQANNGRWYCELECWSWQLDQAQQPAPAQQPQQQGGLPF